eukprot:m.80795 g.80795  ORF g.80795 m.80795 type:complete len:322 (+) comp8057_c0_seq1:16-981(+)
MDILEAFHPVTLGNGTVTFALSVNCTVQCPTLEQFPHSWPLWVIVSLYSCIFVLSAVFLVKSRSQGLITFKNMFLLLQCACSALRITFFSATLPWTFFTLYLFYVMTPIYIQFLTITLLIVFLWKCLLTLNNEHQQITMVLYPVAGFSFALLGAMCAIYAFLVDKFRFSQSEGYDRICAIYGAFMFGVTTILLCIAARRSYYVMDLLAFSADKLRKMNRIKHVFMLYVAVFFARTIWCVSYSADANILQNKMNDLQNSPDLTSYYITMMSFYAVFEVIPSLSLLLMLYSWLPRGRNLVLVQHSGTFSPEYGIHQPLLYGKR